MEVVCLSCDLLADVSLCNLLNMLLLLSQSHGPTPLGIIDVMEVLLHVIKWSRWIKK